MRASFFPGVLPLKATPHRARPSSPRGGVPSFRVTPGKKTPGQSHKNLGGWVRVIASTLLIFLISQLAALLLAELALGLFGGGRHLTLDNSIPGQFFYILLAEALSAYLAIWLVRRRRLPLSIIGLGRRPGGDDALKAAIGFAVFYFLLIIAGVIVASLSPNIDNEKQNLGFTNIQTQSQHTLAFISLVILPPLGEETLIRGYLYSGLRKIWRFWPALLVTSIFFGAAHLELGSGGPVVWAAALDTFILSVILCFLREKTGAIYAGILVHMANNLIAFHYAFH